MYRQVPAATSTSENRPPPKRVPDDTAELLAALPSVEPDETPIMLPADLYPVVASQWAMVHRALDEWEVRLRRARNPLAQAVLHDLKAEVLELERREVVGLRLWAEVLIKTSEQKAWEYSVKLWEEWVRVGGPPKATAKPRTAPKSGPAAEFDDRLGSDP